MRAQDGEQAHGRAVTQVPGWLQQVSAQLVRHPLQRPGARLRSRPLRRILLRTLYCSRRCILRLKDSSMQSVSMILRSRTRL